MFCLIADMRVTVTAEHFTRILWTKKVFFAEKFKFVDSSSFLMIVIFFQLKTPIFLPYFSIVSSSGHGRAVTT